MANFSSESVPFYSLASGPPRPGPGSLFPRRKSDQNAAGDTPVPDFCPIGLYQWGNCSATEFRSFSNLQSGGQRYSACRPRRHKLRIPHPDASVRLRSLRCALLLPRQTLRWFASERPLRGRFSLTLDFRQCKGGNPKGDRRPPLCRRGGGVHRGGTPSKGSRPYAAFWLLFVRTKSNPGPGREGPGAVE